MMLAVRRSAAVWLRRTAQVLARTSVDAWTSVQALELLLDGLRQKCIRVEGIVRRWHMSVSRVQRLVAVELLRGGRTRPRPSAGCRVVEPRSCHCCSIQAPLAITHAHTRKRSARARRSVGKQTCCRFLVAAAAHIRRADAPVRKQISTRGPSDTVRHRRLDASTSSRAEAPWIAGDCSHVWRPGPQDARSRQRNRSKSENSRQRESQAPYAQQLSHARRHNKRALTHKTLMHNFPPPSLHPLPSSVNKGKKCVPHRER